MRTEVKTELARREIHFNNTIFKRDFIEEQIEKSFFGNNFVAVKYTYGESEIYMNGIYYKMNKEVKDYLENLHEQLQEKPFHEIEIKPVIAKFISASSPEGYMYTVELEKIK